MFIKRPGNGRKSYSIVGSDGKTIHDARIEQVNKELRQGTAPDILEFRIKAILESLKPISKPSLASLDNLKIVQSLHLRKLKYKPWLQDTYTLERGLIRAVEALGTVSIATATEDELMTALMPIRDQMKRYNVVRGLNEILLYLKRGFIIPNHKPRSTEEITYIEIGPFLSKIGDVKNKEYQTYIAGLFATGCRFAELPEIFIHSDWERVDVCFQWKRLEGMPWGRYPTKNKKERTATVIEELEVFVKELKVLGRDRLRYLRSHHYDAIFRACKRHFGLTPHDFRHSYAVYWGSSGSSTDQIARALGDTPQVVNDHYRNFKATDTEVQSMRRLRKKNVG